MGRIVAIVGRPNVGKSTLFNRLIGGRKAIVDDFSGVTRDRHYGSMEWAGETFTVIDTGGFVSGSDDVFEAAIRSQVEIAIEEADALLFMVDVQTGITDLDQALVSELRKTKKPILVVANKVDNYKQAGEAAEFYAFGLGDVFSISSANGSGTGDLLDALVKVMPEETEASDEKELPKFALIGKPNVGKSTLLNALIGKERSIVTPIAGTTRDTIHTEYNYFDKNFYLIDTAGIRKKAKVHENIEFYSVLRSIRAIENADVCLLLIDAVEGIGAQEINILHLIVKNKKGLVILVNKWDLIDKETQTSKAFEKKIREKTEPFTDYPIVFISALNKQRIFKAMELALEVNENRKQKISTSKLNELMLDIIQKTPPPSYKGKYIRIKYITQLKIYTPTFVFFCNHPKYVKEAYRRFLENQFRQLFNFHGVPIVIYFRKK